MNTKHIILIGDGMADYPLEQLDGKTPLQAASKPNMDAVAKKGANGLAKNIPDGMESGSDIANLSVLGYDPHEYYTGRGPLEAASIGVELGENDIAFRCNLITEQDGKFVDYSADHISSEEAEQLIHAVNQGLETEEIQFHSGVSYRHLMVLRNTASGEVFCTPPHDVLGEKIDDHLPQGDKETAGLIYDLICRSKPILEGHPINKERKQRGLNPGNMIWPWSGGKKPRIPTIIEKYNLKGASVAAVDLIKGIGIYAGLEPIDVPGATGYLDTDYAAKARYALNALETYDFIFLHVEAPDEAAHAGNLEEKILAIERFDELVVGPILNGLKDYDIWRLMVLPDHPTPIEVRTHTKEPVPFAICGTDVEADSVVAFDEDSAREGYLGTVPGHELIDILVKGVLS